jgi:hypothetical protein
MASKEKENRESVRSNYFIMPQNEDTNAHGAEDREYALMLKIERLESLREELAEAGFGTFEEVQAALTVTNSQTGTNALLDEKRSLLEEIRAEMLDLDLTSYAAIDEQIHTLHQELDELEGFDDDN